MSDYSRCKKFILDTSNNSNGRNGSQCMSNTWKDGYCENHHPETIKQNNENYKDIRIQALTAKVEALESKLEIAEDCINSIMAEEQSLDTESEALGRILLEANLYFQGI